MRDQCGSLRSGHTAKFRRANRKGVLRIRFLGKDRCRNVRLALAADFVIPVAMAG
jgi:hypothetical protein